MKALIYLIPILVVFPLLTAAFIPSLNLQFALTASQVSAGIAIAAAIWTINVIIYLKRTIA
jgi:hypothetical protein